MKPKYGCIQTDIEKFTEADIRHKEQVAQKAYSYKKITWKSIQEEHIEEAQWMLRNTLDKI